MKINKSEYLHAFGLFFWLQWQLYIFLFWLYAGIFLFISLINNNALLLSFPVVILFAISLFIFKRGQYAKAISEKPFLFENIEWDYSDRQIERTGETFSDNIKLDSILGWRQNRSYIYLKKNKEGYYLVPKKSLQQIVLTKMIEDLGQKKK